MDKNWISMLQDQNQLEKVVETNKYTEKFGLSLTQEQAQLILEGRKNELKEQRRVEFGEGITSKIIFSVLSPSVPDFSFILLIPATS